MRRKELSAEEVAKIINLRRGNTSFSEIGRKMGIPRRIVSRVYNESRSSEWREELKAARRAVATEDFRNHRDCLIKLAQSLVNTLDIPQPFRHQISSKEVLFNLWQSDIVGEYGVYEPLKVNRKSEIYLRQNRILLECLKTHTYGKANWQALNEWENAWDTCNGLFNKLREEASKILSNIFKLEPELKDRIVKGSERKNAVERMLDGVVHTVWQDILAGKTDQLPLIQTISRGDGMDEVVFGEGHLGLGLIFAEVAISEEAKEKCTWVTNNVLRGDVSYIVKRLMKEVSIMRKLIEGLTEMLNPLILRPLITNTECELCHL